MADVTGPIRSMPGSRHVCPANSTCDDCGALATVRVQGETDSFGSEMADLCAECHANMLASCLEVESTPSQCDWCHTLASGCKTHRDFEEGMSGPVYMVCRACRKAELERLEESSVEVDRDFYGNDD